MGPDTQFMQKEDSIQTRTIKKSKKIQVLDNRHRNTILSYFFKVERKLYHLVRNSNILSNKYLCRENKQRM